MIALLAGTFVGTLLSILFVITCLLLIFMVVITPSQDPFTQVAMMVPMLAFYGLAILVGRAMKR